MQSCSALAIMDNMHETSDAAVGRRSQPRTTDILAQPHLRRLRLPKRKLLRLKRVTHPVRLPSSWQITKKTCRLLWQARRPLLGIFVTYIILSILLVRGFGGANDISTLRDQLSKGVGGNTGELAAGISSLATTLTSANAGSTASAGVYQMLLGVIVSLATIWTLRQVLGGERVRVRDAFYKSTTPFIPFLLVLVIILIQTLPFMIGGGIYTIVVGYGIAITGLEKLLWGMLFAVLALTTVYMLCSSLFGLYIVTLPDMTPLKALRSARNLVRYRRPAVFRKLIFLVFALGVLAVVLLLPAVLVITGLAAWVFFLFSLAALIVVNAYMYTLYRELLV
jgi:hypothetical protein